MGMTRDCSRGYVSWPMQPVYDVSIPDIYAGLFDHHRYKVAYGGRASGKSWSISQVLVLLAAQKNIRILCCREIQKSIAESSKKRLEDAISEAGLKPIFAITDTKIKCITTGSEFLFFGLHANIGNIKSLEDIDIVWVEEAQYISEESFKILRPTIRKPGSELWFSLNPTSKADPVYAFFFGKDGPPPDSLLIEANWRDNPFLPAESDSERLWCKRTRPDEYLHIWEGEPVGDSVAFRVLPYSWLLQCVDAHIKLDLDINGFRHAGLDVADDGNDCNAYAIRQGPLLENVETWNVKFLHQTAAKAHLRNQEHSVLRMYYDAGGLGAGIKSELSKLKYSSDPNAVYRPEVTKFEPFLFGGSVHGPDHKYTKGILNKDFFAKLNAQAWWNLRLRAENTLRALDGQEVNFERCLFINGKINDIDTLLSELSQCVYDDTTGKIKVDKSPDDQPSPNMADAVIMAFAYDLRKGLKSN